MMARQLKAIALWINANMPGYGAEISKGYCNTDSLVGRFRHPGKGRRGNKLTVRHEGVTIFEHNAAETYRSNSEVENWLRRELDIMDKALTALPDVAANTTDQPKGLEN